MIYSINFYGFRIFDLHIRNQADKNIFAFLASLILFGNYYDIYIYYFKIIYTDNIIEKVVCSIFYVYIFDFITRF